MSERKVLNKYFPPNFDPSAIPRRKVAKDKQYKVRLMAPFTMVCNTCGEIIHAHKKFNARKETVDGENYYSIRIFRFYIRCPRCSAEITFKTDPKNTDYVCEHGATRNFEPLKDERLEGEEEKRLKEAEEENNPMKALENRTLDSKREMDILDALDEIRTRNARNERVDADIILEKLSKEDQEAVMMQLTTEEEEDDMMARAIFKTMEGESVRRIANRDEDEPDPLQLLEGSGLSLSGIPRLVGPAASKRKKDCSELNLGIVLKKNKGNEDSLTTDIKAITTKPAVSALGALGDYNDSDEDI